MLGGLLLSNAEGFYERGCLPIRSQLPRCRFPLRNGKRHLGLYGPKGQVPSCAAQAPMVVLSCPHRPMVEISFIEDRLHLEVKGLDKLWAFKSELDLPLRHIRDVRHDPKAASLSGWWHGDKEAATQIPGVLTAGTFRLYGERIFWDVHHPEKAIIIELHDDRFDELIVEVNDPQATVEQIKANLRK